jgi:hypothetical protein
VATRDDAFREIWQELDELLRRSPWAPRVTIGPEGRRYYRKCQLLACGCCRQLWHLWTAPRSHEAVEMAERVIEERTLPGEQGADPPWETVSDLWAALGKAADASCLEAWKTAMLHEPGRPLIGYPPGLEGDLRSALAWCRLAVRTETERTAQGNVVWCVFGPADALIPAAEPEWLTTTVLALARLMYESRDFSSMPILADALQDAGCDSDDILTHCRGPGPHVRGCWVVDLILEKA